MILTLPRKYSRKTQGFSRILQKKLRNHQGFSRILQKKLRNHQGFSRILQKNSEITKDFQANQKY
jgi:predicted patatin/cPLA2 family phospholipase